MSLSIYGGAKAKKTYVTKVAKNFKKVFGAKNIKTKGGLDIITLSLNESIPNPDEEGRIIKVNLDAQKQVLENLIQIINDLLGEEVLVLDEDKLDEVMTNVEREVEKIGGSFHDEVKLTKQSVQDVANNLKDVLTILSDILKQFKGNELVKATGQEMLKLGEDELVRLENLLDLEHLDEFTSMEEIIEKNKKVKERIKKLGKIPGTKDFSERVSLIMRTLSDTASLAKYVEKLLKILNVTKKDYKEGLDHIEQKLLKNINPKNSVEKQKALKQLENLEAYRGKIVNELGGCAMLAAGARVMKGGKGRDELFGGAKEFIGPGSFSKKVKEEKKARDNLFRLFNKKMKQKIQEIYDEMIEVIKEIGHKIKHSTKLDQFIEAFRRLNNIDKTSTLMDLSGQNESDRAKADREEFLQNLALFKKKAKGLKLEKLVKLVSQVEEDVSNFHGVMKKNVFGGGRYEKTKEDMEYQYRLSKLQDAVKVAAENFGEHVENFDTILGTAIKEKIDGIKRKNYTDKIAHNDHKNDIWDILTRISNKEFVGDASADYFEGDMQVGDVPLADNYAVPAPGVAGMAEEQRQKCSEAARKVMDEIDDRVFKDKEFWLAIEAIEIYLKEFNHAIANNYETFLNIEDILNPIRIINDKPKEDLELIKAENYRDYDDYKKYFKSQVSLKNIISMFIAIGDKIGRVEIRKRTSRTPYQIYETFCHILAYHSIKIDNHAREVIAGDDLASEEIKFLFQALKAMFAKVSTSIGLFRLMKYSSNKQFIEHPRQMLGGSSIYPEIIKGAIDHYMRLPWYAEAYKAIFKVKTEDGMNEGNEKDLIAFIPEMSTTVFGRFTDVMWRKLYSVENGEYHELDGKQIIEAVNLIYTKYPNVYDAVEAFKTEINRRYGKVNDQDVKSWKEYIKKESDIDEDENEDILWSDSRAGILSPAELKGLASTNQDNLKTMYKLDIERNKKLVYNFRNRVDVFFGKKEPFMSFEKYIEGIKKEVDSSKDNTEKFRAVLRGMQGGKDQIKTIDIYLLWYHEFVLLPLDTLKSILDYLNEKMSNFDHRLEQVNSVEKLVINASLGGGARVVVNTQAAINTVAEVALDDMFENIVGFNGANEANTRIIFNAQFKWYKINKDLYDFYLQHDNPDGIISLRDKHSLDVSNLLYIVDQQVENSKRVLNELREYLDDEILDKVKELNRHIKEGKKELKGLSKSLKQLNDAIKDHAGLNYSDFIEFETTKILTNDPLWKKLGGGVNTATVAKGTSFLARFNDLIYEYINTTLNTSNMSYYPLVGFLKNSGLDDRDTFQNGIEKIVDQILTAEKGRLYYTVKELNDLSDIEKDQLKGTLPYYKLLFKQYYEFFDRETFKGGCFRKLRQISEESAANPDGAVQLQYNGDTITFEDLITITKEPVVLHLGNGETAFANTRNTGGDVDQELIHVKYIIQQLFGWITIDDLNSPLIDDGALRDEVFERLTMKFSIDGAAWHDEFAAADTYYKVEVKKEHVSIVFRLQRLKLWLGNDNFGRAILGRNVLDTDCTGAIDIPSDQLLFNADKARNVAYETYSAIQTVLADLDDVPLYAQTYYSFLDNYENANHTIPFMPLSNTSAFTQKLNPSQFTGGNEFKFMYGSRGLMGDEDKLTLDMFPWIDESVKLYGFQTDILDIIKYHGMLMKYMFVDEENLPVMSDIYEPQRYKINLIEDSNRKTSMAKIVNFVSNTITEWNTILRNNILDLNIWPINPNALYRSVPLAGIHNYDYNFLQMILEMFDIPKQVENGSESLDEWVDKPPGLWMITKLREPLEEMTQQNFNIFQAFVRGNTGLDLGRIDHFAKIFEYIQRDSDDTKYTLRPDRKSVIPLIWNLLTTVDAYKTIYNRSRTLDDGAPDPTNNGNLYEYNITNRPGQQPINDFLKDLYKNNLGVTLGFYRRLLDYMLDLDNLPDAGNDASKAQTIIEFKKYLWDNFGKQGDVKNVNGLKGIFLSDVNDTIVNNLSRDYDARVDNILYNGKVMFDQEHSRFPFPNPGIIDRFVTNMARIIPFIRGEGVDANSFDDVAFANDNDIDNPIKEHLKTVLSQEPLKTPNNQVFIQSIFMLDFIQELARRYVRKKLISADLSNKVVKSVQALDSELFETYV